MSDTLAFFNKQPEPTAEPEALSARSAGPPNADPSFLLASLEVLNWGPFHGKHQCEFDPVGTAIIGPTGSGKTTLVDALMTLLAYQPRYNLASTGGHDSDRNLIDYVRGVFGTESVGGDHDHVLRPGRTVTGLAATYSDGQDTVCIGAILWVDGSSNAADELKKLWFFTRNLGRPLDDLLRLHHEGGKSAVVRHAKETVGLRVFENKKQYVAHVRSFFEVGENAFALLNRAAGLKQINSIDQIFRDLVLDDCSVFDRAQKVVAEFDTLQGIYAELETARRQRDSLLPVKVHHTALQSIDTELERLRRLKRLLPVWFARLAVELWKKEIAELENSKAEVESILESMRQDAAVVQARADTLQTAFLQLGGAAIEGLQETIRSKQQHAATLRRHADEYVRLVVSHGLETDLTQAAFDRNRSALPALLEKTRRQSEVARRAALENESRRLNRLDDVKGLEAAMSEVRARPNSNIPPPYQGFREALAQHLDIPADQLPFLAELVQVKGEESRWRGAIERALGSERLRILVPAKQMPSALAWVDSRDNRLHVRLQEIDPSPRSPQWFDDGFARKLDYRPHPMSRHAQYLVGKRDRHCVESTEVLRRTEHAMTPEGTMSDREGRFDKQDQKRLQDDWMTGFDNKAQLNLLQARLEEARRALAELEQEGRTRSQEEQRSVARLQALLSLEKVQFDEINVPRAEDEIRSLQRRLDDLTRPDSDAGRAKAEYDDERARLRMLEERISALMKLLGGREEALDNARDQLRTAEEDHGRGLAAEDLALAEAEFSAFRPASRKRLAEASRDATSRHDTEISRAETKKSDIEKKLVRAMEQAKREDTGALNEAGTELFEVPEYLKRLRILEQEDLPAKLSRFLDYLNTSSGQGVTTLLTDVDNEVTIIEERLDELNQTLSRVQFRPGQCLQLRPERVVHDSLRQLTQAHQKLRRIALQAQDDEGGAHYEALGEVIRRLRHAVDTRQTLPSRAILDPRHRLQFFVVEKDMATGRESGRRTGSQTGSGGEKEMMASYILTASLSYALCPAGAAAPRYATIVLDEAFSKSSPAAASRIIEALREFHLHPLFVTPNKEISLLRAHTRSAILVHKKDRAATLTSLTWQEIQAHERKTAPPALPLILADKSESDDS